MKILQMSEEHIEDVHLVEAASFREPWSKQAFTNEINNPLALYLVGINEDELIAYMGMWVIGDEAHITNIAVKPSYRGLGYGKELLLRAIDETSDRGCISMTLEVRASNEPAISLYRKQGFEVAGRRKNYYSHPKEDALIMWKR
ncbi:ribosomal protein S18-alanine N-acetyltransferase [Vallitalea okinawensis]|uniref:ribosomal protein S18-alanine N-acetyltransferase n=1 Tax=Vallitalea okinawensis TaxID=2078660 RepID=UPI000CFCEB0A|nr:ribosomal protein S18-alanine N-acetyltransferase [Vallitalea okinawensis]